MGQRGKGASAAIYHLNEINTFIKRQLKRQIHAADCRGLSLKKKAQKQSVLHISGVGTGFLMKLSFSFL